MYIKIYSFNFRQKILVIFFDMRTFFYFDKTLFSFTLIRYKSRAPNFDVKQNEAIQSHCTRMYAFNRAVFCLPKS